MRNKSYNTVKPSTANGSEILHRALLWIDGATTTPTIQPPILVHTQQDRYCMLWLTIVASSSAAAASIIVVMVTATHLSLLVMQCCCCSLLLVAAAARSSFFVFAVSDVRIEYLKVEHITFERIRPKHHWQTAGCRKLSLILWYVLS